MSRQARTGRRVAAFAPFLAAVVCSVTLTGCLSGEGNPVSGPDKASCSAGYPPSDVRLPADTCGVQPLHIPSQTTNSAIPHQPQAGSLTLDLYIEGDHTCGIGPGLCAVDDNRPFVPEGSPDPHAHPTRTRVHMTLDFAKQIVTVEISPSCRIHAVDLPVIGPFGPNGSKECFAPNQIGQGTDLTLSDPQPGTVQINLDVLQTAWLAPLRIGQVQNVFEFTPHLDGSIDFAGSGTNFPDLAVIHGGKVACADRATHITNAIIGPGTRNYNCHIPPASQPTGRPTSNACGSNPQDVNSLRFVGKICIVNVSAVGGTAGDILKVTVNVTDEDPNPFSVRASDFQLVDGQSQTVQPLLEQPGCVTGNDAYSLTPKQSLTLPSPLCFMIAPGQQPSSLQWQSGAVSVPLTGQQSAVPTTPPTRAKACGSNPQEVNSLHFVGKICVLKVSTVAGPTGSVAQVSLQVTDEDPNPFGINAADFTLVDAHGETIEATQGLSGCVTDNTDGSDKYSITPNQTLTLPEPVCFELAQGQHPVTLEWQSGAVKVPLR